MTLQKFPLIFLLLQNFVLKTQGEFIPAKIATYEEIKELPNHPEILLIDVREPEMVQKTGKIPTSINIPRNYNYFPLGIFFRKTQIIFPLFLTFLNSGPNRRSPGVKSRRLQSQLWPRIGRQEGAAIDLPLFVWRESGKSGPVCPRFGIRIVRFPALFFGEFIY
jgi:hypothetical protein